MPDTRISSAPPTGPADAHRTEASTQASSSANHRGHTIKHTKVADNLDALSAPNPLLKKVSDGVHEAAVMVGLASATDDLDIPQGHLIKHVRKEKNPQLHPHAYHKWCADGNGRTREQQRAHFESYRLKPEQKLDGGRSQATATVNGSENNGRPAQSPLLQVAENIEAQATSSLEESFVMVAHPDEEVRSKPASATNATRGPVAVPHPTSPILIALDDFDLNISDSLRTRFEAHHQKVESFYEDGDAAVQRDPNAARSKALAKWLNVGTEMVDKYGKDTFWNRVEQNAFHLVKDMLNELQDDKRFLAVLKVAALATPEDLSLEQKEFFAFIGQNIAGALNEASKDVQQLQQQLRYGAVTSDEIDNLLKSNLKAEDRTDAENAKADTVQYRRLVSGLLSLSVNPANELSSVNEMGHALRRAETGLMANYKSCQHAVVNLRKAVNELAVAKYQETHSKSKTLSWAEQQPWSSVIQIRFEDHGGYTDLVPDIRAAIPRDGGNPLAGPSRAEMRDHPLGVYNGLLAPEMREDLQITQTGETHDGLPVVEKPSAMALSWGSALCEAMREDGNFYKKLPDFMQLEEVYYREPAGSSGGPETLKHAWVAGYKLTESNVIQNVEEVQVLPHQIAGELVKYLDASKKLEETQELQKAQIGVAKALVDHFVSTSGAILAQPLEVATPHDLRASTDVLVGVRAQVQREISDQLELNRHNISKTEKWIRQQPWTDLFNVALSVKTVDGEKITSLNIQTKTPADTEGLEQNGLSILMQPNIRESLRLTPLHSGGASVMAGTEPEVVKKPSPLARYFGSVFADNDNPVQLPPFLELKQVQYHSEARFIGRGQLKTCWVVEFKPEVFSRQNPKV